MPVVVAGGIARPEMPVNIIREYRVHGTGANYIGTTSKSYVPMTGMGITVNPEIACGAIVMFSCRCWQYQEVKGYVTMGIALYMDGVFQAETLLSPYANVIIIGDDRPIIEVTNANGTLITAFKSLSPGSHTFQMYYKGASDVMGSSGLRIGERVMQVILFYR